MAKQLLQDMVKIKRKIPEIKIPEIKKDTKPKEIEEMIESMEPRIDHHSNKSRYLLWLVAIISVIFCFFAISFLFSKAQVLVNPKTEDVTLNENLSANKDSETNGLSFDLVVIPGQESEKIPVTGEKDASISATGTVLIFNAFSTSPQSLNANTKLEGSNGKIYKTQTKVVVPGMNKDGTPGQIEVGIYAAEAGAEYNSDPLDFKISGFSGTPKYSKFNVRSEAGTTISGGFAGKAPDISPTDQATALNDLKTLLQTDLLNKAIAQIPDGFILFKDAVFLDTDASKLSSVYNQDNTATLTLSGTFYGVILNEQKLTKKIAEDNIDKYDESDVYIPDIKNLTFSMSGMSDASGTQTVGDSIALADAQSINFNLSGQAKIVWRLDVDKFIADLLGKPKADFTQILSQYSNINSATMTISPIWRTSIPDKAEDVNVIVNYPKQ